MKKLNQNWITEGLIDFEYKKYILLAYLQQIGNSFIENKLYPYFSDLIFHYKNLVSLREQKRGVEKKFQTEIQQIDIKQLKIAYEKVLQDHDLMKEIENIIDYSIPEMEKYLTEGKEIYELIEEQLNIYPVGITPLHSSEGYLFLKNGAKRGTQVYEYQITIFRQSDEKYRGIHANYMSSYENSISTTDEFIKNDLIKQNKNLPNPATYVVETRFEYPLTETLLPIAKRSLVKHIANAA